MSPSQGTSYCLSGSLSCHQSFFPTHQPAGGTDGHWHFIRLFPLINSPLGAVKAERTLPKERGPHRGWAGEESRN